MLDFALGNQAIGTDDAAFAHHRLIEHYSVDADERTVPDAATVKHGAVSNSDVTTYLQGFTGVGVQHAVVLHVAAFTNRNLITVATDHDIEPDAGRLFEGD